MNFFTSNIYFPFVYFFILRSVVVLEWIKHQNVGSFGIILASRMENPDKIEIYKYQMFAKTLNHKWKLAYLVQYPIGKEPKYLLYQGVRPLKDGRKLWKFLIFLELEPFSYYFVFTKIINLSSKKWKSG